MKKTFVLDTNVLLHDAGALFAFADNDVVLPILVLEELDTFKRNQDELGRNARAVTHYLDELQAEGSLSKGVPTPGGGSVRIELEHQDGTGLPAGFDAKKNDSRILSCALALKNNGSGPLQLVTKDINLRVKAEALGIHAVDYTNQTVPTDELYSGVATLLVSREAVDGFYRDGRYEPDGVELAPNEFVLLQDQGDEDHTAIGRFNAKERAVLPLRDPKRVVWGVKALNREQRFAYDALLDDSIVLVTLVGIAGTGKTLLALAAGLDAVVERDAYKRLVISRPVVPVGRDIGYLPGTVEEKLIPRMAPIEDNLEYLFSVRDKGSESRNRGRLLDLMEDGIIELEPLTYIRGRSIPNQFIIVDEAQNLTPLELKTILTRVGKGSKIVLTGDPGQIDHPYLDARSNGLSFVVERFKGQPFFAHVTLTKGERSELAEVAATIMEGGARWMRRPS